jgi:hypothetical protein
MRNQNLKTEKRNRIVSGIQTWTRRMEQRETEIRE